MQRVFNILRQTGSLRAVPFLQCLYCPVAKVTQIGLAIWGTLYHKVSDERTGPHFYEAQRALVPYPPRRLPRPFLSLPQVLHNEPDGVLDTCESGEYLRHQTAGPPIIRVR